MAQPQYENVQSATSAKPNATKADKSAGPGQKRYNGLTIKREPHLRRARRNSALTVVSLYPPEGFDGTQDETLPWTSLGAMLVNNLAGKFVTGLFSSNASLSYYVIRPSLSVLQDLAELGPDQAARVQVELTRALGKVEKAALVEMNKDGDKAIHYDTARHLIVGGTHGMKQRLKGPIQSISLERFVNVRSRTGQLVEFVVEDPMVWETLPDTVRQLCLNAGYEEDAQKSLQEEVKVYTHGRLKDDKWTIYQEAWGAEVPDSRFTCDEEDCPFQFPTFNLIKGEHYGRSYCEDYEGDLLSVDTGEQTHTEGMAAIARIITFVKPGGVTNKKQVAEAPNGSVITGDADTDVTHLQSEKAADLRLVMESQARKEDRLGRAFLMFSPRQGERVTAEEIQEVIQQLQEALGGVYANLLTGWQTPYIRLRLFMLQKAHRLLKLPKDQVTITVLTGDEALGRYAELKALDAAVAVPPEMAAGLAQVLIPLGYYGRRFNALGVDTDGLLMSQDQLDEQQAAQQQAAMAQEVAPEVVKQVGTGVNQQLAAANEQPA